MRPSVVCMLITAGLLFASVSAYAASDLGPWFSTATAFFDDTNATSLAKPDFLPGASRDSMRCGSRGVPVGSGVWQLVRYDRAHTIALAEASTDQCSIAVFKASPPGVSVPNADLSAYSTGRGIRIGSTYEQVLSAYGGKRTPRRNRVVAAYTADVPDTTVSGKRVKDSETIKFVIEHDRVCAMSVSIDLSGNF